MNTTKSETIEQRSLRVGMVGLGMIFEETYRPFFESVRRRPLYEPQFGACAIALDAVASRTGRRAEAYRENAPELGLFESFHGTGAVGQLLKSKVGVVCVATPDDRHFEAASAAL